MIALRTIRSTGALPALVPLQMLLPVCPVGNRATPVSKITYAGEQSYRSLDRIIRYNQCLILHDELSDLELMLELELTRFHDTLSWDTMESPTFVDTKIWFLRLSEARTRQGFDSRDMNASFSCCSRARCI